MLRGARKRRSIDAAGIHLVNAAAWNKNETVRFHVVTSADKWRGSPRTSIGSVLERVPGYGLETYESVAVAAVRLDGVLAAETGPLALWIDVVFVNDRWLRAARFAIRTCVAQAFARAAASDLRSRLRGLPRSA